MGVEERRAREFRRREAEILKAARGLLGGEDWLSVTIEQIAAAAEVGKGTVYKHFGSKEEIYAALSLQHNQQFLERMEAELDNDLPVLEWLRELGRITWRYALEHPDCYTWIEYTQHYSFRSRLPEAMQAAFAESEAAWAGPMAEKLQQGFKEGLFPEQPLEFMMLFAKGALFGNLHQLQLLFGTTVEGFPEEKFIEYVLDAILRGWGASPSE